jgi:hypothetical protein
MPTPQTLIPRYLYYFHFNLDINIRISLCFVNPLPRPGSRAPGHQPGPAARTPTKSSRRAAAAATAGTPELAAEGGRFLELNFCATPRTRGETPAKSLEEKPTDFPQRQPGKNPSRPRHSSQDGRPPAAVITAPGPRARIQPSSLDPDKNKPLGARRTGDLRQAQAIGQTPEPGQAPKPRTGQKKAFFKPPSTYFSSPRPSPGPFSFFIEPFQSQKIKGPVFLGGINVIEML